MLSSVHFLLGHWPFHYKLIEVHFWQSANNMEVDFFFPKASSLCLFPPFGQSKQWLMTFLEQARAGDVILSSFCHWKCLLPFTAFHRRRTPWHGHLVLNLTDGQRRGRRGQGSAPTPLLPSLCGLLNLSHNLQFPLPGFTWNWDQSPLGQKKDSDPVKFCFITTPKHSENLHRAGHPSWWLLPHS
jgi:hypothetical protein